MTCSACRSTRSRPSSIDPPPRRANWPVGRGGECAVRAVKQDSDLAVGQRVVDAFLRATREGDFGTLLALLDPGVVLRLDGGGRSTTRPPVTGAQQVAAFLQSGARPFAPYGRQAVVNGGPGALVVRDSEVIGVVGFTISGGRVTEIDIVADPAKLQRIQASAGTDAP